jgi:hypothetical protein
VWRAQLARSFPGSALGVAAVADWRHAYQLEARGVAGELQCYFTRAAHTDTVLGAPLRFTVNPVTKVRRTEHRHLLAAACSAACTTGVAVTYN